MCDLLFVSMRSCNQGATFPVRTLTLQPDPYDTELKNKYGNGWMDDWMSLKHYVVKLETGSISLTSCIWPSAYSLPVLTTLPLNKLEPKSENFRPQKD